MTFTPTLPEKLGYLVRLCLHVLKHTRTTLFLTNRRFQTLIFRGTNADKQVADIRPWFSGFKVLPLAARKFVPRGLPLAASQN